MDVKSLVNSPDLKQYRIDYDKVKTVRDVVDLFKLMDITFFHTSIEVEDAGDLLIEIKNDGK